MTNCVLGALYGCRAFANEYILFYLLRRLFLFVIVMLHTHFMKFQSLPLLLTKVPEIFMVEFPIIMGFLLHEDSHAIRENYSRKNNCNFGKVSLLFRMER